MNITEWNETWQRIKGRSPNWRPTKTETEDWCLGLKSYPAEMVESVGHLLAKKYSSKEQKLAWYIIECEKRAKAKMVSSTSTFFDDTQTQFKEHQERSEQVIAKLESTPIEILREATIAVLMEVGHLISKPPSGNPREWKQTLRAMVYLKLYGDKEND